MIRIPVFRIFYSTSYSILLLLTLGLLAVSPADGVFQSYRNGDRWSIVIIAGVYLLVLIITLFIYATRLYTTRTHLAAIPKSRLPLQKGDLPKGVRRMVLAGIDRSASVAFRVKPRDLTDELRKEYDEGEEHEKPTSTRAPTWGDVSHPEWAAPHDHEMPGMHYVPVLEELPNLLEARAVSLAPVVPLYPNTGPYGENARLDQDKENNRIPDPTIVALLQRPHSSPLRSYISQLVELGMLPSTELASDFLARYEEARFSPKPLYADDFRTLMALFAELLDTMQGPSQNVVDGAASIEDSESVSTGRELPRQGSHTDLNLAPTKLLREDSDQLASASKLLIPSFERTDSVNRKLSAHFEDPLDHDPTYAAPSTMLATPFFTPYPEGSSARTASTGSLAGSEGTVRTAPSRRTKRSQSGKRTPSASSYQSPHMLRSRNRSRVAYGLGLDNMENGEESERDIKVDQDQEETAQVARSSTDLDESDSESSLESDENEGESDGRDSVRRYTIDRTDEQSGGDEDGSVFRSRGRKS